jgi:hypothetical protein
LAIHSRSSGNGRYTVRHHIVGVSRQGSARGCPISCESAPRFGVEAVNVDQTASAKSRELRVGPIEEDDSPRSRGLFRTYGVGALSRAVSQKDVHLSDSLIAWMAENLLLLKAGLVPQPMSPSRSTARPALCRPRRGIRAVVAFPVRNATRHRSPGDACSLRCVTATSS